MKIGILTYHRAENYGALLQSYALLFYLRNKGFDASFVDYWPEYHRDYFRIFPRLKFREGGLAIKVFCVYMAVVWGYARWRRKRILGGFITEKFGLNSKVKYSNPTDICSEYDLVLYGSDQIWRKQGLPDFPGRDPWYLGSDNIIARKVAYAASVGASSFERQEEYMIKRALSSFEVMSVREESLQLSLERMGMKSTLVVDPVFLLSSKQWRELSLESKQHQNYKYILFYNLLDSSESKCFTENLSRRTKLPIKEITKVYGFNRIGERYVHAASVQDFLSLIDNAEVIVSNSFHGVAFSIIYQKQFFAVGMGNRADRVLSLLKTLGLEKRYITSGKIIEEKIDYTKITDVLSQYKAESESFIESVL